MLGSYVTKSADWYKVWGPPCQAVATSASVTIYGRTHKCHPAAVTPFRVWEQIRAKHGYKMDGTDTGIYNCRHMRHDPAAPMSVHSWGMALDANWLQNPAGNKLVTDMPRPMIDEILALKTVSGAWVFRWLGDSDRDGTSTDQTYIDAMHFEVMAHPLDLATGIAYGTTITTLDISKETDDMSARVWTRDTWQALVDAGLVQGADAVNYWSDPARTDAELAHAENVVLQGLAKGDGHKHGVKGETV